MEPHDGDGNTYVAAISYGKDSLAMLHVVTDVLGWPLHRIVTADVWATDTIPADLPPMVEFKAKVDEMIMQRWGIEVEHYCAMKGGEKMTFERGFYQVRTEASNYCGSLVGWPLGFGRSWCTGELKRPVFRMIAKTCSGAVQFAGIAADEASRIERHSGKEDMRLPLVTAGWTEAMCMGWCQENGLLAPTYETRHRDGCWFCVNAPIDELRDLRRLYPHLWKLMLKWDADMMACGTAKTFHADGRSVHDIERRFRWEDEGYRPTGTRFRWADTENAQMNVDQWMSTKMDGGET